MLKINRLKCRRGIIILGFSKLKTKTLFRIDWGILLSFFDKKTLILFKVSKRKHRIGIIISSFLKRKTKTSFRIVWRILLSFFEKKTPILLKVSRLKYWIGIIILSFLKLKTRRHLGLFDVSYFHFLIKKNIFLTIFIRVELFAHSPSAPINISRYTSIVNDGRGERSSGDCIKEKGILRNFRRKSWTWFSNHKQNCKEGVFIFSSQLSVLCNCLRTKPGRFWSSQIFGKEHSKVRWRRMATIFVCLGTTFLPIRSFEVHFFFGVVFWFRSVIEIVVSSLE